MSEVSGFEKCRNCSNELNETEAKRESGICDRCSDVFYDYYMMDCDDYNSDEACPHCGKPFDDWSDLGCGRCDRRHPHWDYHDH